MTGSTPRIALRPAALCLLLALLPACAFLGGAGRPGPAPPPRPAVAAQPLPITVTGRRVDQLDATTDAERAAATTPAAAGGAVLGRLRVSLGAPADPGFWLQSALVAVPGQGRVALPGGASVAVELRPGAGAAQLSLAAFRALGLGLTELPEVIVTAP